MLLGVERYVRNIGEELQDFRGDSTPGLKWLHDNADTAHREAKKARKEQAEWQVAAS